MGQVLVVGEVYPRFKSGLIRPMITSSRELITRPTDVRVRMFAVGFCASSQDRRSY